MNDYDALGHDFASYKCASVTDWVFGLSVIFDVISPVAGKTILDYGCGTGRLSRFIGANGGKTIGLDVSVAMLDIARQKNTSNVDYHLIKSAKFDFIPDCSVDHIAAGYVFCTVPSLLEISNILKAMHRILKKGGSLVIVENNWEKSHGREFVSHRLEPQDNLSSGQKVGVILKSMSFLRIEDYFWSERDYCNVLTEAGFSIQEVKEPMASIHDEYPWLSEIETPPSFIIVASK